MNPHGQTQKWKDYPQPKNSLRHYYETVFAPARLSNAAHSTAFQYVINLKRFDAFLGRAAKLSDLNDETVGQLVGWLQREHKLSPASAEKLQDNICSLWRFLFNRRLVRWAPTLRKVRAPVRIPTAWTAAELHRLWEYLIRIPGELSGVKANLWFMSLHCVLWDSGGRIGEIRGTQWSQIDLDGGWIVVKAESRKGHFCDKLSRLHPETASLLRLIVSPKRDLVWPWPFNSTYLNTVYREILTRAGLVGPNDKGVGFHRMRKAVASFTKLAGGNAQDVLGHYDPKMTEQVYIDPRICPKQHAADVLPRIHQLGDWKEGKHAG